MRTIFPTGPRQTPVNQPMRTSFLTCLIYTAIMLLVLPLVALQISPSHGLSDIARIVEGMALHFIVAAGLVALVMLIFGFLKTGALTIVLSVASAMFVTGLIDQPDVESKDFTHELTLLTVNIESLYGGEMDDIRDEILKTDPDILVLLEANQNIRQSMGETGLYPHELPCEDVCELVAMSKFPILTSKRQRLTSIWSMPRYGQFKIQVPDESELTIAAVHLTKSWVPQARYEPQRLERRLSQIEGPMIIAGDFNAAPWSYILRQIAHENEIYFRRLPPATWPTEAGIFGVPIDHVGVRNGPRIKSLKGWDGAKNSNHRGVLAEIEY